MLWNNCFGLFLKERFYVPSILILKHLDAAEMTKDATKDAEKGMQLKVIFLPPADTHATFLNFLCSR